MIIRVLIMFGFFVAASLATAQDDPAENTIWRAYGAMPGGGRYSALDQINRETVSTLAEIDRVLGELGTDKTRLLNATVYITNMQLRGEMHRAWCEWIGDDPQRWPQRACVGVDLYQKALVEMVMIAACE